MGYGHSVEQGLCSRCGALRPQAESPPPEVFFLGRAFSVLEAGGCGKEGAKQSAQPGATAPSPSPQALAWALTSALGTFLMDLTLLGALSPTSSSEVSVRVSVWFVLDLKLRAGSSPGVGRKEQGDPGISLTWPPPCPCAPMPTPGPCLYLSPLWCPGGCWGWVGGGRQGPAGAVYPRPGSGSGPAC